MKKLLSIVLTLALLISCVASIPSLTTSAADTAATSVLSDDINSDVYTEIFDSNDYSDHINPNISTDDNSGYWLGGGAWVSSSETKKDALYLKTATTPTKILERNKTVNTNIGDFEWQFQVVADNATAPNISFAFHVNDESDISKYANRKNIFAVTLYGSDYTSDKANFYVPNSLNIEYPNNSGAMRPFSYDTTNTPFVTNPSSYVKLDDSTASEAISLTQYVTINIKLTGRTVEVSAWQTSDKENTFRRQTVTFNTTSSVFNNAFNTAAPSGDFAIISGTSTCNYRVKDMTVSRPSLIFDSNDYSDNWLTQNAGNAAQTYSSTTVGDITVADNVYTLPKYAATDEILANALTADNGTLNLNDFVWETEFAVDNSESNANYAGISFNFHVDKSRTDTASILPGDSGTGTSITNRRYMQSATVYGSAITQTNDAADASTLVLQSSATGGTGYVYGASNVSLDKTSTTDDTTDTYRYSTSSVETSSNLAKNTWYTVRIVLSGNNLYAYIWETANKTGTVRSVYHKLSDTQLASAQSGDFAIVNNYRIVNIKNMRVWDNVDVIRSGEDYSAYTEILSATTYEFESESDLEKLTPFSNNGTLTIAADGDENYRLQLGSTTDTVRTAANLDSFNKNLSDFIITAEFELEKKTNNWSNDSITFRAQDGSNYYTLEIRRRARVTVNTDANCTNHDYIILKKATTDGGTVTLAEASLSRSYEHGNNYKLKLAVIGNTIKVWFAENDMFTQPVLSYVDTDNTFTTGYMYLLHSADTVGYFDNINIYDLTATELASDIDSATGTNLKRGDDVAIDELISKYNAMDEVQQTKLATRKTALDAAVEQLPALEKAGHDVNASGEVDIRDMVAMRNYLADSTAITNESADPLYDDILDKNDIVKLRYWVLGLEWSDTAIQ